jgi:hypothetical protein
MRLRPLALALWGVLVASSACSDATGPSRLAAPAGAAPSQQSVGQQDHESGWSRATSYEVTIDPRRRNVLGFAPYTVSLPANSVCSLDGSGYGIATFDTPCAPERDPVRIRATVSMDAHGHPRIDLQPQMRFNPSKTVVLSTYLGQAALLSADSWRILFCPGSILQGCVDESLYDHSLTTEVDLKTGIIYRRIKHFSGYLAADA